jgi:hypothetical protein
MSHTSPTIDRQVLEILDDGEESWPGLFEQDSRFDKRNLLALISVDQGRESLQSDSHSSNLGVGGSNPSERAST